MDARALALEKELLALETGGSDPDKLAQARQDLIFRYGCPALPKELSTTPANPPSKVVGYNDNHKLTLNARIAWTNTTAP